MFEHRDGKNNVERSRLDPREPGLKIFTNDFYVRKEADIPFVITRLVIGWLVGIDQRNIVPELTEETTYDRLAAANLEEPGRRRQVAEDRLYRPWALDVFEISINKRDLR